MLRALVLTLPDDLTDLTPFSTLSSSPGYGKTKLIDIMFSQHLARELADTEVTVNALCPGFNVTGLGRELWFAGILGRLLTFAGVDDPRRGAGIIVRLATDPELAGKTGGYYSVNNNGPVAPVEPGGDIELQKKLWDLTEGLLVK
jgi:NAD(P)-dependent dehydrogenase (short-subunit alcohol dehydrogenase family)